jgi:hypothetical protein
MKTVFMPLVLLVLSNPVLANQNLNPSECLQMYNSYLDDHNTSRSQILNFIDNCMPVNPANNDEPLHRKLLQIVDDNQNIVTVRV